MNINEEYRRLHCSECGIVYYFTEAWCKRATEARRGWKCPNGHGQVFSEEPEATKLRRERDRLAQRIAEKDDEISNLNKTVKGLKKAVTTTKGQVTRLNTRARNGVCPCCTRSFTNLRNHMATKHPGFQAEAAE